MCTTAIVTGVICLLAGFGVGGVLALNDKLPRLQKMEDEKDTIDFGRIFIIYG